MVRKGRLQEIISKAIYADDPKLYTVGYRDFNEIKEVFLPEFLQISEDFQTIPASRIVSIKRLNKTLYKKAT
ncbi:MAG: DUF504 domain-containing protein [Nitrososphaerales archaeon]